jgi:hypothetical protein
MSEYKTSSFCDSGACTEVAFVKAKSCGDSACVEAASLPVTVLLRATGDPENVLEIDRSSWKHLLSAIKEGAFNV